MPMLQLGEFQFIPQDLPIEEINRTQTQGFEASKRMGAFAAVQKANKGEEKITIPFKLYPGASGKLSAFSTLQKMYDAGDAYLLVSGTGEIMGNWIINSISNNNTWLFKDGVPRKIDGTIELSRVN